MTFNSNHYPITMLQSVFTNLPDVLPANFFKLQSVFTKLPDVQPANFFNIDWGRGGYSNSCDDLG